MKYAVQLTLLLGLITFPLFSQFSVNVKDATDGKCNGGAEVSIENGAQKDYSFAWSNGGEGSSISEICPGNYTVTITSQKGCEWVLSAPVGGRDGCYLEREKILAEVQQPCGKTSGAISIDIQSPIEYSYTWSNKDEGPNIRNLTNGEYCVTIKSIWYDNCSVKKCYKISDEECSSNYDDPIVMINEVSNGANGNDEYVELLVLGNGSCKELVDLQGFILDDNNGEFSIRPEKSRSISKGSLRFVKNKTWSGVPVGSLILVYNRRNRTSSIQLKDDPDDANHDHVYVLPADSDYFEWYDNTLAGTNATQMSFSPLMNRTPPHNWSVIEMMDSGDAMQVRYPDRKYCHGVSYGNPSQITGGPDNLFIAPLNGLGRVIYFDGENPREAKEFKMQSVKLSTPGRPNNKANAAFIDGLCERRNTNYTNGKDPRKIRLLKGEVRPNPFRNSFDLSFDSDLETTVEVSIRNIVGQEVYHDEVSVQVGGNTIHFEHLTGLESGFYVVTAKDGVKTVLQTRIVKIK